MNPTPPQALQADNAGVTSDANLASTGATVNGGCGLADVLTAQTLLAGRTWVAIEHNGQHYRLQTTRAGKLILTK